MPVLLHTLGRLAITVDGATSSAIASQPVRAALLAYIAVERVTTREAAAGLLWPDSDPARARHTLSQTLYQLRSDLGDDVLAAEGETLRALPALEVDTAGFERAVSEERFDEALTLYRGRFLTDLRLADTNAFETWVDRQRARLARLHRVARRRAIERLNETGDTDAALHLAREWAELEPYEDEAWHNIIALLARTGRAAEAIQCYEDYSRRLATEDLEPLEDTTRLVASLRAAGSDRDPAPAAGTVMLEPARPSRPWFRQVAGAAAVILILAAGVLGLVSRRGGGPPEQPRVLVSRLENETGDPALDPVGDMAADWIAQGLAWTGQVRIVPTLDFVPLGPTAAPFTDTTAPLESARGVGADLLVSGRYYRNGDSLEFFAQITEVRSGTVWHALEPVAASPDQPVTAIDRLRERVMGALAARLASDIPLEAPSVAHPPTYDAWLEYRRGAELFIRGAFLEAIPHLGRANALDTTFVRPLLLEMSAWGNSGDLQREDSVIGLLARRADRLAPYERAHFDWAQASLDGDLASAYEAARRAADLARGGPANYVFGRLALDLGRPREALDIFEALDPEPAWTPSWWNTWAHITAAHHALGEHDLELEIARTALQNDRRAWNALLEIRALAALGRVDELSARIVEWSDAPADAGVDAGAMLWLAARELRAHGFHDAADVVLGRAVSWLSDAAAAEPTQSRHWSLLQALALSGRVAESRVTLAALRAEDPESIDYLGFEGVLAARTGDSALASRVDQQLAAIERPYLRGVHTLWRAAIAASLGDTGRAIRLLGQAKDEGCSRGFELHANPDFEALWGHSGFEAFIVGG